MRLFVVVSVVTAVGALARAETPLPVSPIASERAVESAGVFLALEQASRPSPTDGVVRDGWEWKIGSGEGAANISGLVATSLFEAGEASANELFIDAAKLRARADRQALERGERLSAPDLELVARVASLEHDARSMALAKEALASRLGAEGAAGLARSVLARRRGAPNLAGYDLALFAEAAAACDESELAKSLVFEALRTRDEWLTQPRSTYGLISEAALVTVEVELGLSAQAGGDATLLVLAQGDDGSWHTRETEATAWATRALSLYAEATHSRAADEASRRGRRWLERTQLARGAWADFNDGLPEPFVGLVYSSTTAEALRALVSSPRPRARE